MKNGKDEQLELAKDKIRRYSRLYNILKEELNLCRQRNNALEIENLQLCTDILKIIRYRQKQNSQHEVPEIYTEL